MNAEEIMEILKNKLRAVSVEVEDESSDHTGHEGARSGGGHYRVTIVSEAFISKPYLERHRMVYDALGDALGRDVHALAIRALAPGETG